MLPSKHFFASCILVIALWPLFGFWSLFIFLGSFFIDVDHYLRYVFINKDLNLVKACNFFKNRNHYGRKKEVYIFHTLETLASLVVLSFFHISFLITLIGWFVHMMMDFSYDLKSRKLVFNKKIVFTDIVIKKLLYNSQEKKVL